MNVLFPRNLQEKLIKISNENKIFLEGNLLKIVEYDGNEDFQAYIEVCKSRDKETRAKRLEVTKQVQKQNKELAEKARLLEKKANENDALMSELKHALEQAENAKEEVLKDLNFLQQKTQFELIGNIVRVALWVIMGVGFIVTGMYIIAIFHQSNETTLIGNTWSNLFGILLTNSFSIIGTIMGVKYASDKSSKEKK